MSTQLIINLKVFYEKVEGMKFTARTLNAEMRPDRYLKTGPVLPEYFKSFAIIMFCYQYCLNVINLSRLLCFFTSTA
jgi:hypothetical protein